MSIACEYALLRAVPHVYLGAFVDIGVVLHARTAEFLDARVITEREQLARVIPEVDLDLLIRYLESWLAICRGEEGAGAVALLPTSERFHWLTAPRSDVLQPGPRVRVMAEDPAAELDRRFREVLR